LKREDRTSQPFISSGAGTIFGQGIKTGNAKLMGSLSNLARVFIPEISVL